MVSCLGESILILDVVDKKTIGLVQFVVGLILALGGGVLIATSSYRFLK